MNVQLPGFVIAGLYKNSLVITGAVEAPPEKPAVQVTENAANPKPQTAPLAQKKWYLGDNKKGVAMVVRDENAVYISEEQLETIQNMIKGLKMNLADIAIVNLHNEPVSFNDLKQQLQARHVIMFGATTAQLGLPFTIPYYQVQNYAGCTLLSAPPETLAGPAATTEAIKLEKRKLWESLKRMEF